MPLHTKKVLVVQTILTSETHSFRNTTYWVPDVDFDPDETDKWTNTADAYFSAINGFHEDFLDDDASLSGVKVTFYNGDGGVWEGFSTIGAQEGEALLVDPMPPGVAAIIQRRTNKVGRQHQGRIFIPFVTEGGISEGGLIENSGGLSVVQGLRSYASFLGADQTFDDVLYHARHYNRKDDALEVITFCRAMNRVGYRRDRNRGYMPRLALAAP